jgi:hypothetical protein
MKREKGIDTEREEAERNSWEETEEKTSDRDIGRGTVQ